MLRAFLNPQGNIDLEDSYWAEHPDFRGQLVYGKQFTQDKNTTLIFLDQDETWKDTIYFVHKIAAITTAKCRSYRTAH